MRIRTIKPEFWASESMGRLSRDERLVFIGLWSLADDYGRFRADPRFVAGQLFPYDTDALRVVGRSLQSLDQEGCILLYEADGSHYGHIPAWERHQRIDKRTSSKLPEPPENTCRENSRGIQNPREDSPRKGREGKGREQGEEGKVVALPHPLQSVWNDNRAPSMPEWKETSPTRKKHADARLKERPAEEWADVVRRLSMSDFASGRSGKWSATPDWLVSSPGNAAKVLEGNYDNRGQGQSALPVFEETREVEF